MVEEVGVEEMAQAAQDRMSVRSAFVAPDLMMSA